MPVPPVGLKVATGQWTWSPQERILLINILKLFASTPYSGLLDNPVVGSVQLCLQGSTRSHAAQEGETHFVWGRMTGAVCHQYIFQV